ncbi:MULTISPECIES: SulP family inorganic anion transporter [unclassified Gilliamella]|uniref:SulP family inorganic anion transporter n=1 Tax=unclassified Gilliamella TaxID=2685620 RepID=UPI00226AF414|nr:MULTISPECIES: SulP family inorganic anion transporter [unclassified Gilliamella]MCX8641126.1 SulP family inorganic anion transporter [Gilliamella sp. B3835]MCX8707115.1 SulP family inorganic anion transporter [Gilliamella sp. B3783]MCX8710388.1 SulP family inorganic anion transporter [Gilliamella sp. B3780]MCX8711514.1 SulP family inorganic anion transporter [Gilliamella sp. B3468]MCX8715070.1 SulP family inorganic anion transporter [Gilliamella sp. B3781]
MGRVTNSALMQKIALWMPGLKNLLHYRRDYFSFDLKAGLSVAAVSLPVSIAYAELTGVGAIAGLYSTILPLIVYALFGSSRQLIVGPDTATCAVVAAVVLPLASNDPILRWQLVVILTIMIGIWCIIAGKLHLGALADLLSQPILIGLLNGISITIMVDQLAKTLGFSYDYSYLIERVVYLPFKIPQIHLFTALISLFTLVILIGLKKIKPRYPAPLFAVVVMTFLSWLFNFESHNIRIIGAVTGDFIPVESWLDFDKGLMRDLVVPSLNIAIICFVSMMITVRSFASKNNYETNADVEFKALGMANIVAGLSQGFVVSGTSSRTAVNDANGGKTQLVSIIAAIIIGFVVLFLLSPLKYIPTCVLGVILIYSSISLINFQTIIRFFKFDRDAFYLSLTTLVSVLVIGIIPGMALAVLLGLFLFLRRVFRPKDQLLGVDESGRIHSLGKDVKPLDNTIIYRFNSPLTYFNIAYFKRRIISYIDEAPQPISYVIVDAIPCFTYKDVSVLSGIEELVKSLKVRNVILILSGRRKTLKNWFKQMNIKLDEQYIEFAYDLYFSVRLVQSKEHMENNEDALNQ